jgi:hypothetical protein
MLRNSVVNILLKVGLALPLLYTALAAFVVPARVITRWPLFVTHHVDESTLTVFTGIVCVAFVIWLFFGTRKFISAATLTLCIGLTILFNIKSESFVFGLAPLFFIALALSIRYYPRVRVVSETFLTPLHEGHLSGEKNSEVTTHGHTTSRTAR